MLFHSFAFIFGFFPVAFLGFFLCARINHRLAALWLGVMSLGFYGWWSVSAVPLLMASITFSYVISQKLQPGSGRSDRTRRHLLTLAITTHLVLLGFFKYADFFVSNVNEALGAFNQTPLPLLSIALPLGISFFTFTQIAFLVDCWQGRVRERNFIHYLLFVTYFPHLIAGPVLHHGQMMPQFAQAATYRPQRDNILVGLGLFIVGLAKKMLLADPMGEYADALFQTASGGTPPMFFMAWFGMLSYAFQIYFDFSGYSDMAIGLSLCFGIVLPLNFNSPYKAANIIDFWRRWHISLSTFLRDYLYIPLGGNRRGKARRYGNLLVTMLLGGLWHGASWTFVLWGGLHGLFLMINHLWRNLTGGARPYGPVGRLFSWAVTFLGVCLAWVLFRADSLGAALAVYKGLLGLNGFSLPAAFRQKFPALEKHATVIFDDLWQSAPTQGDTAFIVVFALAFILCLATPNMNRFVNPRTRVLPRRPGLVGLALGALFALSLVNVMKSGPSPFLYFRF